MCFGLFIIQKTQKNCNKCCLSLKFDCSFRPSLNKSVNWPLFYCHVDRFCPKAKRLVHYSPHIWSNVRLMAPANGSFFRTSSFSNQWSSVRTLNERLFGQWFTNAWVIRVLWTQKRGKMWDYCHTEQQAANAGGGGEQMRGWQRD